MKEDKTVEKVVEKNPLADMTIANLEAKHNAKVAEEEVKDALKLIRCTITCNNKNKVSYQGEIFCARNAKVADVKKFVPFGVPTHVPQILLNMIKEKKYQMFKKEKVNGNQVTKPYYIDEYNIQILPPLTTEEIEAIKQKQLAEGKN